MTRAERLLDLVTTLLAAREPLPFAQLRDHFDDYRLASDEAAIRKFERDKAELLELGIPLEYREDSEESEGGYLLQRERYFLPSLDLSPAQLALLGVAGMAAASMEGFLWGQEITRALEKIALSLGTPRASRASMAAQVPSARLAVHTRPRGDPTRVSGNFLLLQDAIARRKRVSFEYEGLYRGETTERTVEPSGLFLREAAWNLQGHCLLREAPRSFLLDRIVSLEVNKKRPKSPDFEPQVAQGGGPKPSGEVSAVGAQGSPALGSLRALTRLKPWDYPVEAPLSVRLWLSPRLAPLATSLFGEQVEISVARAGAEGSAELCFEVRYQAALLERLLSLPGAVRVLAPQTLAQEHQRRLREALATLERSHPAPEAPSEPPA